MTGLRGLHNDTINLLVESVIPLKVCNQEYMMETSLMLV